MNGKSAISPEMAIRLTKAFGSTPETWLKMQLAFDLAEARKHEHRNRIRRYKAEKVKVLR
jgi:plasmid maintenance system antidote protein VapI